MSLKYTPDIDGLRALAVMLVIFNHVNISLFSGGFIGVDIFFVISGYLITAIIYKEMIAKSFSISHFYKKRVIRLAPAFFTVLLITSIFSLWMMLSNELVEYAKSIVYSVFLMANVYMRKEIGGYFSTSADEIPLLHLWSLGVEEQFYIFWPLLLLLLVRKAHAKWLIWIVLGLIIFSLFYAEQQILKNADKAYYRMPVRAVEMFLGALVCFLPKLNIQVVFIRIVTWAALIILIVCAIQFNEQTIFPGLNALIPCIATALILYCTRIQTNLNFVLAHPITTWIGKISYPMYLWHWPVIVFLNIYLVEFTPIIQCFVILISIVLAYFTYKFIELPARKWLVLPNKKVILMGFLLPSIIFSIFAGLIYSTQGFPGRFDEKVERQVAALDSAAHILRKSCHDAPEDRTQLPDSSICAFGEVKKSKIDILLLGDSHANSLMGALDIWAKDANLRGYDPTQSTTPYLPDVKVFEKKSTNDFTENIKFTERNESLTTYIEKNKYSITVLTAYFPTYLSDKVKLVDGKGGTNQEVFEQGMIRALTQIFKMSDRVILILDVPNITGFQANCAVRAYSLGINQECLIPAQQMRDRDRDYLKIIASLELNFPKLEVVNPNQVLCNEKVCQSTLNDIPLYRDKDNNHLSYLGAAEFGKVYLKEFGNPFKEKSR